MKNLNSYLTLKNELSSCGTTTIIVSTYSGTTMHLLHKKGKFAEKKTANGSACFLKYNIGLASVKKIVNNAYWVSLSTR